MFRVGQRTAGCSEMRKRLVIVGAPRYAELAQHDLCGEPAGSARFGQRGQPNPASGATWRRKTATSCGSTRILRDVAREERQPAEQSDLEQIDEAKEHEWRG